MTEDHEVNQGPSAPLASLSHLHSATTLHSTTAASEGIFDEVDHLMSSLIRNRRCPSYVYGVFDRSGLIHVGSGGPDVVAPSGWGPEDMRFRIASMSKSFTSAAIMRLAADGLVHIDEPVSSIIPEMRNLRRFRADDRDVTIHDLLSMSSGLATDDAWADRQESLPVERFRKIIASGVRTVFSPGEGYGYSNLGYAILGDVVLRVTGMDAAEYIRSSFMEPLGLRQTSYDYRDHPPELLVRGFHKGVEKEWIEEPFTVPGAFSGIGGVISSVRDISIWAGWLCSAFEDDETADKGPLPRRARRLMQVDHTVIGAMMPPSTPSTGPSPATRAPLPSRPLASSYGYGLRVEHDPRFGVIISHSGGYPGYGSHMRWHPASSLGLVVLTNGRYSTPSVVAAPAFDIILDDLAFPRSSNAPLLWSETIAARRRIDLVMGALGSAQRGHSGGKPETACRQALMSLTDILSGNVFQDEDVEQRAHGLMDLLSRRHATEVRGKADAAPADDGELPLDGASTMGERSSSPADLSWMTGRGALRCRCSISMTPTTPAKVQTLSFRPIRALVVTHSRSSSLRRMDPWLKGHGLEIQPVFGGDGLPDSLDEFDALIVLGGAPLPDDDERFPWLPATRGLIAEALRRSIPYLGICLGGQLLAYVTGGTVLHRSLPPEHGMTVIEALPEARHDPLLSVLPDVFPMVENHVDHIATPPSKAVILARSSRSPVQVFRMGACAWGLQFHPEVGAANVEAWDDEDRSRVEDDGFLWDEVLREGRRHDAENTRICRDLTLRFADICMARL